MNIRGGLAVLVLAVVVVLPAHALVIYGGAAGHTTNPGGGLPWDNVGNTGVYLGAFETGYWVITANHVGSAGITLGGTAYSSVAGSAHQIGSTDLLLYRIDVSSAGAPALANLTFSNLTPSVGSEVVMIGDGGGVKAWGTNTVEGYSAYAVIKDGPETVGLFTSYDPITGESQGQSGDSGGGLFFEYAEGSWMLSGILSAIGTLDGGTPFTASVAVAYYYADIAAIVGNAIAPVPEPATWATLLGSVVLITAVVVRRRLP